MKNWHQFLLHGCSGRGGGAGVGPVKTSTGSAFSYFHSASGNTDEVVLSLMG